MEKRNFRPVGGNRPQRPRFSDDEEQNTLIFGLRPILEALEAGKDIEKIYLQKNLQEATLREISVMAHKAEVPVAQVPLEKLNKLTRRNHQGVVAYLSLVQYQPLQEIVIRLFEEGHTPLIVLLDRITDVRNFGAIARSAACMGAHALVIPSRGGAQVNGDAVKTSAGALHTLPVCREPNLKNTLRYLQSSGIQVVACTEKTEKDLPFSPADLTQPTALIMGSEEDGISPEYLKLADHKVRIPISGPITSLNVSVAAGIVLYEVVRQRSLAEAGR